jgi:hypothetical protein
LPPIIAGRRYPVLVRYAERQPNLTGSDQLGNRLSVARNHHGFTFLYQFEEARELRLSFVDVNLHAFSLVHLSS